MIANKFNEKLYCTWNASGFAQQRPRASKLYNLTHCMYNVMDIKDTNSAFMKTISERR